MASCVKSKSDDCEFVKHHMSRATQKHWGSLRFAVRVVVVVAVEERLLLRDVLLAVWLAYGFHAPSNTSHCMHLGGMVPPSPRWHHEFSSQQLQIFVSFTTCFLSCFTTCFSSCFKTCFTVPFLEGVCRSGSLNHSSFRWGSRKRG